MSEIFRHDVRTYVRIHAMVVITRSEIRCSCFVFICQITGQRHFFKALHDQRKPAMNRCVWFWRLLWALNHQHLYNRHGPAFNRCAWFFPLGWWQLPRTWNCIPEQTPVFHFRSGPKGDPVLYAAKGTLKQIIPVPRACVTHKAQSWTGTAVFPAVSPFVISNQTT